MHVPWSSWCSALLIHGNILAVLDLLCFCCCITIKYLTNIDFILSIYEKNRLYQKNSLLFREYLLQSNTFLDCRGVRRQQVPYTPQSGFCDFHWSRHISPRFVCWMVFIATFSMFSVISCRPAFISGGGLTTAENYRPSVEKLVILVTYDCSRTHLARS